ncbi:hypothetical protein [Salinarimonas soli]|uniref:Uncharacterized protein n=1 Tax=Salinarimonas soli TaxID=1638099 RepID=A0A5B2VDX0_9HYPH|nr:hypothetical protein [Salinarimonas soli]KAA2236630.1 hypothetical protein F0L46_14285 [Salinarimonas soli]
MRLIVDNGIFGAGLGLAAAGGLAAGDVGGLGHLALNGIEGALGLGLLGLGLMGLGAAACVSTAVMLLGAGEERRFGRGTPVLVPVPVPVRRRPRRG